jgi:hypothetical protein
MGHVPLPEREARENAAPNPAPIEVLPVPEDTEEIDITLLTEDDE